MSGGISAIKGFDYQATVILDKLFKHFDTHAPLAKARPEGIDDLDLSWTEGTTEHRQYIQIKKPTEDCNGNLNPTPWTLSATVQELLPSAITHLSGNNHSQLWIVGDKFDDNVTSLINARDRAPIIVPQAYWGAIHILARNKTLASFEVEPALRKKLLLRKIPPALPTKPERAHTILVESFEKFTKVLGVSKDISIQYANKVSELHQNLPEILARIEISDTYGSEQTVIQRVYDQLIQRYRLSREVIENTLFRNLRGFINDISKQAGRSFNQEELEVELCCVWPQMIPIKGFPILELDHISRRDLVEKFTTEWTGKAIEAIGISGSGKTMLTTEIAERSRLIAPERLVYYAEVRPNISFRDVLVGVAFHLRRQNIPEPFSIAIMNDKTNEDILAELASSYSTISCETFFLIDLVEGNCSTAFSRDLATFIRALSSSSCRVAIFGQESALRELSPLERDEHNVSRLDIRGFNFEEFVKLVTHHHPNPDRATLWDIYERVTVGRSSGLFAKLAQSLARSASLQNMIKIAATPPEDILAHAEQLRFAQISEGARGAAEKLVCFALPFLRKDAEEIFPDENIGMAIREMLTLGLLRYHDEELLEMHETVRAGLEAMLAVCVRYSSHLTLANWYSKKGVVTAEIFHLEESGKLAEAHMRARELFMCGEQWLSISPYVIRNKLVSAKNVIDVIAKPQAVEGSFLLTSLLKQLEKPTPVNKLLEIIYEQPQRYFTDYRWSSVIVETILEFDPKQLHNLIIFSIDNATNEEQIESTLNWLGLAMQRKGSTVTSHTIVFFNSQTPQVKIMLAGILLRDKRREALQAVFKFITSNQFLNNNKKKHLSLNLSLNINKLNDAVEFLAAMPRAKMAAMQISKSVLLGPLANFVWNKRNKLRTYCIEIIEDNFPEEIVFENAIRVLIFLADPSLFKLHGQFLSRKDSIRSFAALLPMLQPAFFDYNHYEEQLFDCNATLENRLTALQILASSDIDLSRIYNYLKKTEIDPKQQKIWDFIFLMLSIKNPFPEAIALLEENIDVSDDNIDHFVIPALFQLGKLPVPEATTMLIHALTHSSLDIRKCAALCLSQRRSSKALPALIEQYIKENDEMLSVGLATAIVASGAKSTSDLHSRYISPAIELWQCILTMRLRDINMADKLVNIAIDPFKNWQVRRAAIFAAGQLPYNIALERIIPFIMDKHSPLTIDQSENLGCHSLISSFLTNNLEDVFHIFTKGRAGFIDLFGEIFEEIWSDWIINQDLPSGTDTAGWFYDRLAFHGWPEKREAPEHLLNELNIPLLQSAVLRSLRLCGRPDLIEQQLATANHVWIAMKCLTERRRAENRDSELPTRLRSLVEISPCKGNNLLHRVINEMNNWGMTISEVKPPVISPNKSPESITYLTYNDVVSVLSGANLKIEISLPLVLKNISPEQCERLIKLADPANDSYQGVETYIPMIKFTSNSHVVTQKKWTSKGSDNSPKSLIRSVIAATNSFGLPIPWLHELMTGAWATDFIKNYLINLGALNDSSRFYEELSKYEDILIVSLCNTNQYASIRKYIDKRIIPTLMRYISSGTDELFEGLCIIASQIDIPEIDPVLSGLLYRWSQRFDKTSIISQNDDNHHLWRGFKQLTQHPRFTNIKEWVSLLENVLQTPIQWFHAQDIVRILERDPRSYILIESRLFKTENWAHFYQEEIDQLDKAAEQLFGQLLKE